MSKEPTNESKVSRRKFLTIGGGIVAVAVAGAVGYELAQTRAPTAVTNSTMASSAMASTAALQTPATPFFRMNFLCPINNLSRVAWAGMIADNLKKIGVNCNIIFADWDVIWPRVYTDIAHTRESYDDGGWDSLTIGWDIPIAYDPTTYFSQKSEPLYNAMMWTNNDSESLINQINATSDINQRADLLKQWQRVWLNDIPNVMVWGDAYVAGLNPNLQGWQEGMWAVRPDHWIGWKMTGVPSATVVQAQAGEAFNFGGPLMTLDYEYMYAGGAFSCLANYDYDTKKFVPYVADSWTVSPDAKTWVVNLRKDVTWHDGWPVTAKDVKFTWDAMLNPDVAAVPEGVWEGVFGKGGTDTYSITGDYQITANLPNPCGTFVEKILSWGAETCSGILLPEHVLDSIDPKDWRKQTFNTGVGSYTVKTPDGKTYTAGGPIGNGPYVFLGYDPTKRQAHLKQNTNFFDSANQGNVTDVYQTYYSNVDAAIADLKAGLIQIVSPEWQWFAKAYEVTAPWGKIIAPKSLVIYEFDFNLNSPYWGTGVQTPLGQSDSTQAAAAARWVRQAFAECVPKQEIRDTLMAGYGEPIVTPVLDCTAYGYDPTLQNYPFDLVAAEACMQKAGYKY